MRLFFAAALLVSPLSASAAEPQERAAMPNLSDRQVDAERQCENDPMRQARGRNYSGTMKLGELPPADAFLAVHREVDGCTEPLLVRDYRGEAPQVREHVPQSDEDADRPL